MEELKLDGQLDIDELLPQPEILNRIIDTGVGNDNVETSQVTGGKDGVGNGIGDRDGVGSCNVGTWQVIGDKDGVGIGDKEGVDT